MHLFFLQEHFEYNKPIFIWITPISLCQCVPRTNTFMSPVLNEGPFCGGGQQFENCISNFVSCFDEF